MRRFRPEHVIAEKRQLLDGFRDRLSAAMEHALRERSHRLELLAGRLSGCSPLDKITGGCAFVTKEDGLRLRSASEASCGDLLDLRLSDGVLRARVTDRILAEK